MGVCLLFDVSIEVVLGRCMGGESVLGADLLVCVCGMQGFGDVVA